MAELLSLRPYQRDAIDAVWEAILTGTNRPAVVLPTGAGKTVIFSHMALEFIERHPFNRVLILVHRDELVKQAVKKLHDIAPGLTVGTVKASTDEYGAQIIVGSVQTLRNYARRDTIKNVGLVIVDEAHHAAATSYRTVLDHFGCFGFNCTCDPGDDGRIHGYGCDFPKDTTPAVGFSATLSRDDKKSLAEIWDVVVYQRDILDMIPDYLVDPIGKMVTVDGLSLAEVAVQNGDLAAGSLSDALLTSDAVNAVVAAYLEHAKDRPTLLFAPTVLSAQTFTEAFRTAGVRARTVWGAMPNEERAEVLAGFAAGTIDVIINCMVLTEGFDEPKASCAIIARPTRSASLYVQMVGRVLRKHPGKTDALVLDVVGASQDHMLATLADLTSQRIPEVPEGMSLATAAVRERERGNPSLANYVMSMSDVDLFHRSPSAWLQTREGIYFLTTRCPYTDKCPTVPGGTRNMPCGNHLWFLWPDEPGTYRVGVRAVRRTGGRYIHDDPTDLETAMSWAEEYASQEDSTLTNRSASWRKKTAKPTEAQRSYAETIGIILPDDVTKQECSDMISIVVASRVLDKALKAKRG